MNLVAKEYVASKADKKGVLILSEMAGASKELSDAIIINPNDKDAIVSALEQAIAMPDEEQYRLMKSMQNVVRLYDIHNWVELFLDRLKYISDKQKNFSTVPLDEKIIREMMQRYHHAQSRIIFLDLDESLLISDNFPLPSQLDNNIYKMLKTITSSKKNRVVCISGADSQSLESWFDGLRVDLIAEHGMWVRKFGQAWETFDDVSNEWKYDIFPTLEHFVKRTPGSFIEEKDFSLVWHYRKAESGLGDMRTRELSEHLKYLVSNMDLNVVEENMVVEIKSSLINKGRAVKKWLEEYDAQFVFAFGGNNSSEDFFKILPPNAYSIKIGRSHTTHAKYMLLKKGLIYEIFQMMALTKEYNLN
jgi:trehalose 6-phosphate synthase/phosphatase